MVPESDLELGQLRLLDVDNRVVVPVDTHIRFIVTGQDVIHDFAVPSLGVKIDAVPGRLNQTSVIIQREGVFYGQCSEINHRFPLCVSIMTNRVNCIDHSC
jgi:cytochrome c oxidase subunit 2